MSGRSRSSSPLSLSPHTRKTRLTIAASSPARWRRSGRIARVTISRISCGTPGTRYATLEPTGQIRPGAVPRVCGMTVAPSGTRACRRLLSGMRRPREANRPRMRSATSSSGCNTTPITSAMASRVMSSCVGPSPPHTITASDRRSASRSTDTMRAWLSPTFTWWCEAMPAAASCSPIQAELVSTT